MRAPHCALVLGGYVNGYSIIRELYSEGVREIILFDSGDSLSQKSHKVLRCERIEKHESGLLDAIKSLSEDYERIVLFPTDDLYLELIYAILPQIQEHCVIPFNPSNLPTALSKFEQYSICERLALPYPKTLHLCTYQDLKALSKLDLPLLIKPEKRDDLRVPLFRSLSIENEADLARHRDLLARHIEQGHHFLASEVIPGDGGNIYAYACYRSPSGQILNEWTGKKLSQYPNDFGIFASASNQAPDVIREQGRRLVEAMDLHGFLEPEFKYDFRDGQYKLMEINLRSMMWNRVGHLSGVNLHYTQHQYALGLDPPRYEQDKSREIRIVYAKHEVVNLLTRRGYLSTLLRNLAHGRIHFAIWDLSDPGPFLYDFVSTCKEVTKACLRRLKTA